MTDIELLKDCIKTLSNITIPCGLVKQVGVPVAAVAENLQALLNAIEEQAKKQEQEAGDAEDALADAHPEDTLPIDGAEIIELNPGEVS